jgi:hypothetical protein
LAEQNAGQKNQNQELTEALQICKVIIAGLIALFIAWMLNNAIEYVATFIRG